MIDLTSLVKASAQLNSATIELSHKVVRRYLAATEPSPEVVAELTFEGLIRRADELGLLLSPVAVWKDFRQARTETSHTYNEDKAIGVVARIPAFATEITYLLAKLQQRTQPNA